MIHPHTELRWVSTEIGHGVFATKDIKKGTITYALDPLDIQIKRDDPRLNDKNAISHIEKYSYIDSQGSRILSWDHAKYVNHSCNANTLSTGYGFEMAIRDIAAGEEMTDDYGLLNSSGALVGCRCASDCRGTIGDSSFWILTEAWDRKIKPALLRLRDVSQPLRPLLSREVADGLELFFEHHIYKSVKCLYYEPSLDIEESAAQYSDGLSPLMARP